MPERLQNPVLFPTVLWGTSRVTFLPADAPLPTEMPVPAALVFAVQDSGFVLADIAGRGWCVPGGRLEPGESPEQAARREAGEEIGATLGPLRLLGHFVQADEKTGPQILAAAFAGPVTRLDPLPPGSEARGVMQRTLSELPRHYYFWDALLEAVFASALAQQESAGRTEDGGSLFQNSK
jgi:8-oxo-dGTP diphosphatase